MNYATFAALTNYDTAAAAIAANPVDGTAWLLNETKIFQDGRMGNPRSANTDENTYKKGTQRQKSRTLTPTISRNKTTGVDENGTAITVGKSVQSSLKDFQPNATNKVTAANTKAPSIRHKVAWYVTDSSQTTGYRRVFGLLEDPTTTSPYRDDDNQTRL